MKFEEKATYILGIRIENSSTQINLSQEAFINQKLEEFQIDEIQKSKTPMEVNWRPTGEGNLIQCKFRELIGSMMYCMTCTRPDIAISVSKLSQFLESPTEEVWSAGIKVLKYLNETKNMRLSYSHNGNLNIEAYVDSSFNPNAQDNKSWTGWCVFIGGNLVSWKSKKQNLVALSSAESELIALTDVCTEIMWYFNLMDSIGIAVKTPVTINEDNKAVIQMTEKNVRNSRTKHQARRTQFIKELISSGLIQLVYCESSKMVADMLTQPMAKPQFENLRSQMCLGKFGLKGSVKLNGVKSHGDNPN